MTLKKIGVATFALAGAAALCAHHMKSQQHGSGAKPCPCMPGTAADEGEQQREHACSQQEVRDAA